MRRKSPPRRQQTPRNSRHRNEFRFRKGIYGDHQRCGGRRPRTHEQPRHRVGDPTGRGAVDHCGHRRPTSEFNPSSSEEVRFLQIWIEPERTGLAPSSEQRASFEPALTHGRIGPPHQLVDETGRAFADVRFARAFVRERLPDPRNRKRRRDRRRAHRQQHQP